MSNERICIFVLFLAMNRSFLSFLVFLLLFFFWGGGGGGIALVRFSFSFFRFLCDFVKFTPVFSRPADHVLYIIGLATAHLVLYIAVYSTGFS